MTDDNQQQQEDLDKDNKAPEATFSKDDISKIMKQNFHGQEHISELETETKGLRDKITDLEAEVTKRATMEEMMAEMRSTGYDSDSGVIAPQVDENALLAKLEQQMTARFTEQQATQQLEQNWTKSMSALEQKHGEGYESYVDERAKALDMTNDQMVQMAATAPKAFLDLMSASPSSQAAPTTSSSRTLFAEDTQTEALEYSKVAKLQRNIETDEGRKARELWTDVEWQKKHRTRMLDLAKTEGSNFGNIIR